MRWCPYFTPFGSVAEKFLDFNFNANVKGFFFSVQKGPPFMNDGGSIVLNASIAATKGFPGMSVYSATKPPFGHSRAPDQRTPRASPSRERHQARSRLSRIGVSVCGVELFVDGDAAQV